MEPFTTTLLVGAAAGAAGGLAGKTAEAVVELAKSRPSPTGKIKSTKSRRHFSSR